MSNVFHPGPFLRRLLLADASVSAAVGVVMSVGAGPLQRLTGLPVSLLTIAGLSLLPYAAYLLWAATRRSLLRAAVWVPIALNLLWAADCIVVGFVAGPDITALGRVFLAVQVVTVLVFAELEWAGLRRTPMLTA